MTPRQSVEKIDEQGGRSLAVAVDVTDSDSTENLAAQALGEFGRIDILVNNAGTIGAPGWEGRDRPNDDDWDHIHNVNVHGIARVTDAVVEHMKPRRYGKIVNIASVAGRTGTRTNFAYGASKAAAINLTRCYASDLAPYSIQRELCMSGPGVDEDVGAHCQSPDRAEYRRRDDNPRVVRSVRGEQHTPRERADARGDRKRRGFPRVRGRERHNRTGPERGRRVCDELGSELRVSLAEPLIRAIGGSEALCRARLSPSPQPSPF